MVAAGIQRCADLAHLPLVELRTYRAELATEEDRVSYWRRLVQARLDVLRTAPGRPSHTSPALDPERLRRTLAGGAVASRRLALVRLRPVDDLPPLPDLAVLWTSLAGEDPQARQELVRRLEAAEDGLSGYRATLHGWIDEATGELIARYREDPASCLSALPLRPQ